MIASKINERVSRQDVTEEGANDFKLLNSSAPKPQENSLSVRWLTGGCAEVQYWTETGWDQVLATGLRANHLPDCGHPAVQGRGGREGGAREVDAGDMQQRIHGPGADVEGKERQGKFRANCRGGWLMLHLSVGKRAVTGNHLQKIMPTPVALRNASPYSSLSHDAQQYGHAVPASTYTVAQKDPGRTTVVSIEEKKTPCVGFRLMTWNRCGLDLLLDSGGPSSQLKTEQRLQLWVETSLTITGSENCIQHVAPPHPSVHCSPSVGLGGCLGARWAADCGSSPGGTLS